MTNITELRKRAMYDPQSLTKEEWDTVYKAATTVPKKEFYEDGPPKPTPAKQKRGGWW